MASSLTTDCGIAGAGLWPQYGPSARRRGTLGSMPVDHAREMRKAPTRYEARLWTWLRNRRFGAYKFRRQHPVGPYILDFYCHELRLAIEVDGMQHEEIWRADYERARTQFLNALDIEVLRIQNELLRQQAEIVAAQIEYA